MLQRVLLMGTRAHESQDNDRTQCATGRPGPAAASRSGVAEAREHRFPGGCPGGLGRRSRRLQEAPRRHAGRQRHGLRADPASRSEAREHDGRSADGPHADAGPAGRGQDAARTRPRLSHSSGRLSGRSGTVPSGCRSPWSGMARACPSTSSCARWPRNAASAPSARSSPGPAPTAASD